MTALCVDASPFVRSRLAWALLLVLAASILSAMGPIALKVAVDGLNNAHAGFDHLRIAAFIALYVASQWLARSAEEIKGLIFARAERRLLRALSERLFGHLLRLPFRFHLDRRTGAISQILDNGVQGYQQILHHTVFTLFPVLAELVTIIAVLLHLVDPVFLALFSGALLAYAIAFARAVASVTRLADGACAASIESNATMVDGLLCVETLKCFAAEPIALQRVSLSLSGAETRWLEFHRRYSLNGLSVAGIFAVFLAATMGYAAREVLRGSLTVGGFVLVGTYMLQVVRPIEMLGYAVQGLSQGMALARRMLEVLRLPSESQLDRPVARASAAGEIEFRNVSASYAAGRPALSDVSFRVRAGTTLAIVGPSGSGKSTIARLLLRLLEPERGRVWLDGIPIEDWPLTKLRARVAVVPQDTVLLNDTIAYNIALGKGDATPAEIEEAARLAHLHGFITSLPDRYETRVGERGIQLSGGERQRISIARAAIRRPGIYVLDEATSSLDTCTEREILRDLAGLAMQCTTLIIAHRLSTIMHADEIAVLQDGSIIERGAHEFLLREKGCYAALWAAQQRGSIAA
ncbi:MAG TPA: ABC transporter ATP-binding protein [Steroidobacteraceae bacterium]|nr:ABC transporter ATP-binding protein [Steroidobacteraceae bacterium]